MRNQLVSIRPKVPTLIIENETREIERFQNQTLRPILKLQNDLIVSIFEHHLQKYKSNFYQLKESKRREYIEKIMQKDRKLHHLLMGIIVGHFTNSEWESYILFEKEANRRITNLLIQRLDDQLYKNSTL